MTKYARLFKITHDLRVIGKTLPSPYINYLICELQRLYIYTDRKLDEILKREKENKKDVWK